MSDPTIKENTFGQLFKQLRQKAKYNQRDLATCLGCNFTYISKIENNRLESLPSELFLTKAAYLFKVDADWLILSAGKIPQRHLEALSKIAKIYRNKFVDVLKLLEEKEKIEKYLLLKK